MEETAMHVDDLVQVPDVELKPLPLAELKLLPIPELKPLERAELKLLPGLEAASCNGYKMLKPLERAELKLLPVELKPLPLAKLK